MSAAVLQPEGELCHDRMLEIREAVTDAMRRGHAHVILDLTAVDHVNYVTLGGLLERAGRLRRLGGDLHLVLRSPYLKNIFRFAGVHHLLPSHSTVEAAVASIEVDSVRTATVSAGSCGSWVPRML